MGQENMIKSDSLPLWWGEFHPEPDVVYGWTLGPLSCFIQRREMEWQLCPHIVMPWPDDRPSGGLLSHGSSMADCRGELQRHVFAGTEPRLLIEPALAERPVVVRSAAPIMIAAGQQTNFFVSTPLWFRVKVHKEQHLLLDTPTYRLSDTWFGPSTMEGELCYAATTTGRLYVGDLPVRAHRAITPVRICNDGEAPLRLEKISMPVPYLALFDTRSHGLWTQELTLIHDDRKALTQIVVADRPPAPYDQAQPVSTARKKADKGMLHRTFSAFFGG